MPIYSGSQKIKTLQFGGQKIKEGWTLADGVWQQVYSALKMPEIGAMTVTVPTASVITTSCAIPAGDVGDLMVMAIAFEGSINAAPAGWTFQQAVSGVDDWGRIAIYTKVRTASETAATVTFTQFKKHIVRILSITGGKSVVASDSYSLNASGTANTVYGVSTSVPKCLILTAVGLRSAVDPTLTWPSPHSALTKDTGTATSGFFLTLGLGAESRAVAGAGANFSVTASTAVASRGTASIAISPI